MRKTVIAVQLRIAEVETGWGKRLAQLCKSVCEGAILGKELDIYESSASAYVDDSAQSQAKEEGSHGS
jgi:hypothetical protein